MNIRRWLVTLLLAAVAQSGLALAQNPLVGSYLESQIGFLVVFEQQPDGQLGGALHGASGPMPLQIQADFQNVMGSFMLDGTQTGFAAQLQADNQTLYIWLYSLDASGQPVTSTYEMYTATRQAAETVQPPAVQQPVPPVLGAPGAAQPPVTPGQPQTPPPLGQPPVTEAPPLGAPVTQPPALGMPPAAEPPPLGAPPVSTPAADATQALFGYWQGSMMLNGLNFVNVAVFNSDGTFREDIYLDGQPVVWYSGNYTMDASGRLEQVSNDRSPQVCVQGQCGPNEAPLVSVSTVAWLSTDSFIITSVPQDGSEPTQVQMQRIQPGQ